MSSIAVDIWVHLSPDYLPYPCGLIVDLFRCRTHGCQGKLWALHGFPVRGRKAGHCINSVPYGSPCGDEEVDSSLKSEQFGDWLSSKYNKEDFIEKKDRLAVFLHYLCFKLIYKSKKIFREFQDLDAAKRIPLSLDAANVLIFVFADVSLTSCDLCGCSLYLLGYNNPKFMAQWMEAACGGVSL